MYPNKYGLQTLKNVSQILQTEFKNLCTYDVKMMYLTTFVKFSLKSALVT